MNTHEITKDPLQSYSAWLSSLNLTGITGWRMRKRGWIETIEISGRLYVSRSAIEKFQERAERGEFAKKPIVPESSLKNDRKG
jgi:hypothetical protein